MHNDQHSAPQNPSERHIVWKCSLLETPALERQRHLQSIYLPEVILLTSYERQTSPEPRLTWSDTAGEL